MKGDCGDQGPSGSQGPAGKRCAIGPGGPPERLVKLYPQDLLEVNAMLVQVVKKGKREMSVVLVHRDS